MNRLLALTKLEQVCRFVLCSIVCSIPNRSNMWKSFSLLSGTLRSVGFGKYIVEFKMLSVYIVFLLLFMMSGRLICLPCVAIRWETAFITLYLYHINYLH